MHRSRGCPVLALIQAAINFNKDAAIQQVLEAAGRIAIVVGIALVAIVAIRRLVRPILAVAIREQMASDIGVSAVQTTLNIYRELVGSEQRLKGEILARNVRSGYLPEFAFPAAFKPIFPNGWADVAKRESFELPDQPQEK